MRPRKFDYDRAGEIVKAFDADPHCSALAKKFHMPYNVIWKIVTSQGRVIPRHDATDLPENLPPIPSDLLASYVPRTVPNGQISHSMKPAVTDRGDAGPDPLRPFHPIARSALPRLRSLEV
jgi:hypothetical protein